MVCAKITGLDKSQAKYLWDMVNAISQENTPNEDYSISIETSIQLHRQNSLWHDGGVASISYKGFTFSIEATGGIKIYLYDAVTDKELVYMKDKRYKGAFYDKMHRYLRTDQALERAIDEVHDKYRLCIEDSCWWEVFVFDKDNNMLPDTWIADSDKILTVVVETLKRMDKYLDELK